MGNGIYWRNNWWFIVDYLNRSYGPNRGMKVGFSVSSLGVTFGILATIYATSAFEAVLILAITFFLLRWSGIQWAVSSFIVPRAYAGQWGGHIGFWETLWGIIIPLVLVQLLQLQRHIQRACLYLFS